MGFYVTYLAAMPYFRRTNNMLLVFMDITVKLFCLLSLLMNYIRKSSSQTYTVKRLLSLVLL